MQENTQNFDDLSGFITASASSANAFESVATASKEEIRQPTLCKEKLVIFLDRCAEIKTMDVSLSDGKKVDALERLKKVVRMFLHLKNTLSASRNDEFYFLTESTNGKFNLASAKTDVDTVLNQLKRFNVDSKNADDAQFFQLDDILRRIFELVPLPVEPMDHDHCGTTANPPYIVRIILIVTRSKGDVLLELDEEINKKLRNPFLYVDILYIHEYPDKEKNVNEIYRKLLALESKRGYIFESGPDITNWHNYSASLLAHPFLRPKHGELQNSVESRETEEEKIRPDEKLVEI